MNDKKNRKKISRGLMFALAKASRRLLALAIASGIVSGASSAGLIAVMNDAIHRGAGATDRAWVFLALLGLVFLSGMGSEILLVRLAQRSMFNMRLLMSHRILGSPFRRLEEIGMHRLFATLTDDVQAITSALLVLPVMVINVAVLIGCFAYLAWLSPTIFAVCFFFGLIGVVTYQGLTARAVRNLKEARDREDSLFEHFRGMTSGAKELKLNRHRRQLFLKEDFEPTAKAFQESTVRGMTLFAAAANWGQLLFFVVIGILIFFLPAAHRQETVVLSGAVLAITYLMGPLTAILNMVPTLSKAVIAAEKIESLALSDAPDCLPAHSDVPETSAYCGIRLRQAAYSYQTEQGDGFTLGPIDLTLHANECIFLIGGNGSGKSTLLKLLTGLYAPQQGDILLNGKSITSEDERENYRQLFSAVFSDFYLFDRLPQRPDQTPADIDAAAAQYLELLRLAEKVSVKEGRFSTTFLSQGQRKRLALISAYLEDRSVYIFDEWAADQDPLFRDIFYTRLIPELKRRGKTILLASHDDRYFHLADRIIKLDAGKLV